MKFSVEHIKEILDKEKLGSWVVEHKRQAAVGCIALCLVIVAGASLAGSGGKKKTVSNTQLFIPMRPCSIFSRIFLTQKNTYKRRNGCTTLMYLCITRELTHFLICF